jgi:hypothetical protein
MHNTSIIISTLTILLGSTTAYAQDDATTIRKAVEPADAWQRGLQAGATVATFIAVGCGRAAMARLDGDAATEKSYSDRGISFSQHRGVHAALGALALGLDLTAAWQQLRIDRERGKREFRHVAHASLFWSSVTALAASAALGIASGQLHRSGDRDVAHGLAIAMQVTGYASVGSSALDLLLFGGHDNATIIGTKLAF